MFAIHGIRQCPNSYQLFMVLTKIAWVTFSNVMPTGTFCQFEAFRLEDIYCKIFTHELYANILYFYLLQLVVFFFADQYLFATRFLAAIEKCFMGLI